MATRIIRGTRHLTLQKREYRILAEATKAVGLALNLSTFERMGNCWGGYSPWALSIHTDARDVNAKCDEHALITLASTVDPSALRAVGKNRPELDWAALEDHEIYSFIVQHEIGHRLDNFDGWGVMTIKDLAIRDECHARIRFANEVLADRFAWSKIRPGEPIPLSETGKKLKKKTELSLQFLEKHAPKMGQSFRPMRKGQYFDVPDYMLATPERAAFLGPQVDPLLVADRAAYYSERDKQYSMPLF